jgi:hypothetical protein
MKTKKLFVMVKGLILLTFIACSSGKNPKPENSIIGHWQALSGNFEQISFTNDDSARFSANLHERIAVAGTWQLNGDKLLVHYDNQETEEFNIRLSGDTLEFNHGDEIYVRMNETEDSTNNETSYGNEILDEINLNMGMRFSKIKPCNEDWLPTQLIWSIISCPVVFDSTENEAASETIEEIVGILSLEGYEPDPEMTTKIISAYKNNTQMILVRNNPDHEAHAGDTVMVDVLCGSQDELNQ